MEGLVFHREILEKQLKYKGNNKLTREMIKKIVKENIHKLHGQEIIVKTPFFGFHIYFVDLYRDSFEVSWSLALPAKQS